MATLIFVYGTLKKGLENHHLIEDTENRLCIPRGTARSVEKYPLIIASKYNIPFLLYAPGQGCNVEGELYEVDEKRLHRLDELEGHPHLYERKDIMLTTFDDDNSKGDNIIKAQAYFLVKYRPELLNLDMMSNYDGTQEGKKFEFPKESFWFEVHTDYTESDTF